VGLSEQRLGKALAGERHNNFIVWGKRTGQGVPLTIPEVCPVSRNDKWRLGRLFAELRIE
jgi:hypothetical protein